jgi:hypothetical protein
MSRDSTQALLNSIGMTEKNAIQTLLHSIDESPYSIQEWMDALIRFQEWEASQNRVISIEKKLEYLSCCIEGLKGSEKLMTFPDLLSEYLRIHGVLDSLP